MDEIGEVILGTVIGFALLAGFLMMLYIAYKALWTFGRTVAGARRSSRRWQQDAINRDLVAHREHSRRN